MSSNEAFFDTSVLLYLLSDDQAKSNKVESLLNRGGTFSVQVLNEFAAVATRKLKLSIPEIREILGTLRAVCRVVPLTEEVHDRGLDTIESHRFSVYDAMIVASALIADCDVLYSEDMQHCQVINKSLTIINPFRP